MPPDQSPDAGLASLAGMPGLLTLRVERTAVGDAGVPHLLGLASRLD